MLPATPNRNAARRHAGFFFTMCSLLLTLCVTTLAHAQAADLVRTPVLARSPRREQAYTQFLQDQQTPGSPDYHHWLTPIEMGKRFGVSSHDIHAVTVWLQSQNLHVDCISNSRERIVFAGVASAIGAAFGAEMHYYRVSGEKR